MYIASHRSMFSTFRFILSAMSIALPSHGSRERTISVAGTPPSCCSGGEGRRREGGEGGRRERREDEEQDSTRTPGPPGGKCSMLKIQFASPMAQGVREGSSLFVTSLYTPRDTQPPFPPSWILPRVSGAPGGSQGPSGNSPPTQPRTPGGSQGPPNECPGSNGSLRAASGPPGAPQASSKTPLSKKYNKKQYLFHVCSKSPGGTRATSRTQELP